MQIPTKTEPFWESADASKLREFLESPTGQRMLMHVSDQIPPLPDGSDNGKFLVAAGIIKGWNSTLQAILSLTIEQPAPVQISETYPSIDNDAAWDDNKTTNP